MNNTINIIIDKIFNEIGIATDMEYTVMDQDFLSVLKENGKVLKFSFDGYIGNINHYNETILRPLKDVKQMQMLFNYYLNKLKILGEIDNFKYLPILDTTTKKIYITADIFKIKNNYDFNSPINNFDVITYTSRAYNSKTLGYVDLIFQMAGEDTSILVELDKEENNDIY